MRLMQRLVPVLVLLLLLLGCSKASDTKGESSGQVSRATLGDEWPLTVEAGELRCDGSGGVGAVTFTAAGKTYAVNGIAKQRGIQAIDPIWAPNPSIPGTKKSIGPLIDRGLELCK